MRIAAALTLDHPAHEILGEIIRRRMLPDQCIEIAVGVDNREPLLLRKRRRCGQRNESSHEDKFASHKGSLHLQFMGGETRLFMRNSGNFVTQPESLSLVPSRFESVCAGIPSQRHGI